MSNEVAVFNPAKLPAFARAKEGKSALTKALAGGGAGGYPRRISIKGGVFRLVADGKEVAQIEDRYLDVVIVNAAPSVQRSYYAAKYSENENAGPACWSENGERPDESVSSPQSTMCATCPQNIKGSGDGDTRACRFSQRIAVVLANDMEGDVLQMVVPAKSLFGKEDNGNFPLQAYARWLSAQGVEPNMVITRMRFDTKAESPKLYFKAMRWLEDSEFEGVTEQSNSENAKKAVEAPKFTGGNEVSVPKAPALAAPVQQAAPAAEEDEEAPPPPPAAKRGRKPKAEQTEDAADVAEPTVRKAPEAPAVPKSKSVASLVTAWDTDD
jgi:hypothetical protein